MAATPSSYGRKHQVLVSNDDGIQAPGLRALVEALAQSPEVEVYVCAPSSERSAQSHAITLGRCVNHMGLGFGTAAAQQRSSSRNYSNKASSSTCKGHTAVLTAA